MPLEGLQAVDLAFRLPVGPGLAERGSDGLDVGAKAPTKDDRTLVSASVNQSGSCSARPWRTISAKRVNVSDNSRQCDGAKAGQRGALGVGGVSGRASARALSESWRVSRRDGPAGPSCGAQGFEGGFRARLWARR